jgi:hypothetical protein
MRRLRLWFSEQGIQVIEEGLERRRIYAFYLRLPGGAIQRMDLNLDVLELDPEAVIRNAFEPMLEYKRLA